LRLKILKEITTSFNSKCTGFYNLLLRLGRFYHQMLSAVLLSQSTGSSTRAAKPSVPFGGWYRGHEASMWSAVCSSAQHLQFAEGNTPYLCIVERNSRTPVRRRFSLNQKGLGTVGTFPVLVRSRCWSGAK